MEMNLTYYDVEEEVSWRQSESGLYFRGLKWIEEAGTSVIIQDAYVRFVCEWGTAKIRIIAAKTKGSPLLDKEFWLGEPGYIDFVQIPKNSRYVMVEGKREDSNTLLSVGILPLGK